MSVFNVGDKVIFAWCESKNNERLVGQKAEVLSVLFNSLRVRFESGEVTVFFADRFEFLEKGSSPLLRKVKYMYERQPYMQRKNHAIC